jgi:hypothetical protein
MWRAICADANDLLQQGHIPAAARLRALVADAL